MKNFIFYFSIVVSLWLLQAFFTIIQIKSFSNEIKKLKKEGKVIIGKSKGGFRAGTLLLILIGSNGKIKKSKVMQGVTVFSRMKDFQTFNNMTLNELEFKKNELNINKGIQKALDSIYKRG